jgi:hypothetical protein
VSGPTQSKLKFNVAGVKEVQKNSNPATDNKESQLLQLLKGQKGVDIQNDFDEE